jgi:hypothetical protein
MRPHHGLTTRASDPPIRSSAPADASRRAVDLHVAAPGSLGTPGSPVSLGSSASPGDPGACKVMSISPSKAEMIESFRILRARMRALDEAQRVIEALLESDHPRSLRSAMSRSSG